MDIGRRQLLVGSAALMAFSGVASGSPSGVTPVPRQVGSGQLASSPVVRGRLALKTRIKAITNVFETGTPATDYAYAEDLNDGRGLTVTSYGFCTYVDEVTKVIKRYDTLVPETTLSGYLLFLPPAGSGVEMAKLDGFVEAWRQENSISGLLASICEKVADQLYFNPSVKFAHRAGIASHAGHAIIYDTLLQHGDDDGDADSLNAIYRQTVLQTGWPDKGQEPDMLRGFLETRREVLAKPSNQATAKVWAESLPRVDALIALLDENPQLSAPVRVHNSQVDTTVP